MFHPIPLDCNNKDSEYNMNLEKYLISNNIFIRLEELFGMGRHSGCGGSQYLPSQALHGPLNVAVSGSIRILGLGASFKSLHLPRSLWLFDGLRASSREPFKST